MNTGIKIFYAFFTALFLSHQLLLIASFGVGVSLSKYKSDPAKEEEDQDNLDEE